jgi:y4mF family transcriptional regulator
MKANTVRDLGALVRSSRRAQGLTQADLATRLRVSREWVVRLEGGHPRLEAQKVLDALTVLGLVLDVEQRERPAVPGKASTKSAAGNKAQVMAKQGAKTTTTTRTARKTPMTKTVTDTGAKGRTVSPRKGPTADPFDTLFSKRKR